MNKDLRPFVCISDKCAQGPHEFEDFSIWAKHMRDAHTTKWPQKVHKPHIWACDVDHDVEEFFDEAQFQDHLASRHSDCADDEKHAIAESCQISRERCRNICPICGYDLLNVQVPELQTSIQEEVKILNEFALLDLMAKHVAGHLRQLAFYSSGNLEDEGETTPEASLITSEAQILDGDSKVRCPSGADQLDDIELEFEDIEVRERDDSHPSSNDHDVQWSSSEIEILTKTPRYLASSAIQDWSAVKQELPKLNDSTTKSHVAANHGLIELHDGGIQLISRELWTEKSANGDETALLPTSDVAAAIRHALKEAMVSTNSRSKFVPVTKLGEIISHPNMSRLIHALESCSHLSLREKEHLANKICLFKDDSRCSTYKRIVAALIKIEREEDILSAVEEGFSDDYISLKSTGDFILRDEKTGRVCQTMKKWDSETRVRYWKSLDEYNAPVFMRPRWGGIYHYVLDGRTILPFEWEPSVQGTNANSINQIGLDLSTGDNESYFGTIKCVRIHADHHRFGNYGVCK